jgi:hypothetical protein
MLLEEGYNGQSLYVVSPGLVRDALKYAQEKQEMMNQGRTEGTHWHEGQKRNEFFGVLAELVVRAHVDRFGTWEIEHAPLVQTKEHLMVKEFPFDHIVNGWTVETKAIPPNSFSERLANGEGCWGRWVVRNNLMVKCREFKQADLYLAVKFFSEEVYTLSGWATGEEVEQARKLGSHEPAYTIALTQLAPMSEIPFVRTRRGEK